MTRIERFAVGRARLALVLAALPTAALVWPNTARPALPADAARPLQAVAAGIAPLPGVAPPLATTRASAAALRLQRVPRARAQAALRRAERVAVRDRRLRRLLAASPDVERRPGAMLHAIRVAEALGCRVTQNPAVGDPPRGGHVGHSKHYQRYPGTNIGRAIDVYCSHATLLRYFRWAEDHRRDIFLDDLFYTPAGYSYDAGKIWRVLVGGHSDHVHLSI
ncbi:MAG: hypothetical protein R3C15_14600 [Thermoleophilia bacterium]